MQNGIRILYSHFHNKIHNHTEVLRTGPCIILPELDLYPRSPWLHRHNLGSIYLQGWIQDFKRGGVRSWGQLTIIGSGSIFPHIKKEEISTCIWGWKGGGIHTRPLSPPEVFSPQCVSQLIKKTVLLKIKKLNSSIDMQTRNRWVYIQINTIIMDGLTEF